MPSRFPVVAFLVLAIAGCASSYEIHRPVTPASVVLTSASAASSNLLIENIDVPSNYKLMLFDSNVIRTTLAKRLRKTSIFSKVHESKFDDTAHTMVVNVTGSIKRSDHKGRSAAAGLLNIAIPVLGSYLVGQEETLAIKLNAIFGSENHGTYEFSCTSSGTLKYQTMSEVTPEFRQQLVSDCVQQIIDQIAADSAFLNALR